ncbi:3-hydroxylacyl-ACP dehydratase [Hydrogenophaga sp. 5NK40-0174]|uniref:3-hydroxylacyl-ACP dehydratase n=1 Tax=Hydrogenophaga sp. 5NK40-0174 TaxID=3127649 RepID=UPI00334181D4
MCLLERVVDWSSDGLHAQSEGHVAADHPLRANDRLDAVHGIEYAAQAMAVHGGLLAEEAGADGPPRQGYLTSVRGVQFAVGRLDDLPGAIDVKVQRLSGDELNILYRFSLWHDGRELLSGRASVMLDASGASA